MTQPTDQKASAAASAANEWLSAFQAALTARDPEAAAAVARHADASVVGTAIVDRIARGLDGNGMAGPALVGDVLGFVGSLAAGVRDARVNAVQ